MSTTTAPVLRDSVEVDGRLRTFTVVKPAHATAPHPLVLVFHGSRQSADKHRAFTGGMYDELASDAVVAYLDGYRGNWNDARRGSRFPARRDGVDDIGFTRAVIAKLAAEHGADPDRVVAVGYSNGGQMVMRLVHEAPELLAGAVVIAATMPAPENFLSTGAPVVPMPLLAIHGTKDPITSYDGGSFTWWQRLVFKVGGESWSAPQTARYFASRNGITADPVTTRLPAAGSGDPTEVERTDYRQDGRPPVTLLTVHNGGHTIPGPADAPAVIGRTSHHVTTARVLADFFGLRR
ncbi:alpha/beta hydrolase family esterase [Lentzea sp. NPDC059081]|uniref:alpha/beta hydrolase family esterase n=1 Tax=Lentzea sp. NPDC059081 TaxID=3346719 RepID=UPI00367FF5CB